MSLSVITPLGQRIEIPREIEAEGGAAVDTHVRKVAGADLHKRKAKEVAALASSLEHPKDLVWLRSIEEANPKSEGGRTTVLRAIERRVQELEEAARAEEESQAADGEAAPEDEE